jgi:tight adherence protein C
LIMTIGQSWSLEHWILASAAVAAASAFLGFGLWWRNVPKAVIRTPSLPWFWRHHGTVIRLMGEPLTTRLWPAAQAELERLAKRAGLSVELPVQSLVGSMATAALYGAAVGALLSGVSSVSSVSSVIDLERVVVIGSITILGAFLPLIWLRDHAQRREREALRTLPFLLDVLTLALEAGANLGGALAIAVDRLSPGALRDEMGHVLRDLRAGRPRAQAFAALADRIQLPAIASLVAALQIAERQGASLGAVLRAQAQQARTARWLRAERQAMQAPVRMMLPLTICIFPGTFAVLLFPVAMRLLREGFGG